MVFLTTDHSDIHGSIRIIRDDLCNPWSKNTSRTTLRVRLWHPRVSGILVESTGALPAYNWTTQLVSVKTRLATLLFSAIALMVAIAARGADDAKKPDDRPVLALIISEALQGAGSPGDDFTRLDIAFEKVATKRKWPVKLVAERFAAGVPDYPAEVYISSQVVRREMGNELVYRAWTYLMIKGKKTDFGIVEYRYSPRLGANTYDETDKVFLGYANKVADKLEPILFPKTDKAPDKPKS